MNVPSISNSAASVQQAANARAVDGDYKTRGVGHEVKDADGDYKPTKTATALPAPQAAPSASAAVTSSSSVQDAILNLVKGGA